MRDLALQPIKLFLGRLRSRQRQPSQVIAALGDCLAGLGLELGLALAELVLLKFQPLLRSQDVRHAATNLLQRLQLLLIGEVQRLVGILGLVEDRVHFLLNHVGHSLYHAHFEKPPRHKATPSSRRL